MPEPRRSRLRQLLERPDARPRVTRAVTALLGAGVVSLATLGVLIIWHLVRRGRLIREGLGQPRAVRLTGFDTPTPTPGPDAPSNEPRTS